MPLFASIPDELLIFLAIPIVGAVIIAMTAIIANTYRKMQREDMTATLKMEMIQRGMSAEEIERILRARPSAPSPRHGRRDWHWSPEREKSKS
ncbi:MAG TPA: hypothetical protein VGJ16_00490 [Pirellulales bacterium]